ncbi:unnamed protein product [Parascedosporium putredinis]|uniref:ceramidase n=1 Tax=Parascedosporium putredinis TaxID=1442378 RepID=A0A9P1H7B9_9PEZI|nr:unnamed protein product [Parascedosporium putredinis]CAI7999705.1 unnamed protein product [Parascedosporium putredinis]
MSSSPVPAAAVTTSPKPREPGHPIPRFTVDLSQPPHTRYAHIAPHFRASRGPRLGSLLRSLARLLLRRVYCPRETAELRGISAASGVPLHLLVAFNVLLDVLLGCTSGGMRVASGLPHIHNNPTNDSNGNDDDDDDDDSRIVHLRTLDWGMDPIRALTVELDFVRHPGGPVVASTVTYFGYVGVLTGVRKGLSLSLNFRPRHDVSTPWKRLAFRWHQAMVVLGFRRSISSVLRRLLFDDDDDDDGDDDDKESEGSPPGLSESKVADADHLSGTLHTSPTFLAAYNHDRADEDHPDRLTDIAHHLADAKPSCAMADLVTYSLERKARLDALWTASANPGSASRSQRSRPRGRDMPPRAATGTVTLADVLRLIKDPEIRNDETHYAAVMDPATGEILWSRAYDVDDFP